MSGLWQALRKIFIGSTPKMTGPVARANQNRVRSGDTPWRGPSSPMRASGPTLLRQPNVQVVKNRAGRAGIPYWRLRGWRRTSGTMYIGYFKTRLGRRHGVIKWISQSNYSIYIHNIPRKILNGPHRACFKEVKPGKFRVHFAQHPRDLNGAIFYMETLLQEAFQHGYRS